VKINSINVVGDYPTNLVQGFEIVNYDQQLQAELALLWS